MNIKTSASRILFHLNARTLVRFAAPSVSARLAQSFLIHWILCGVEGILLPDREHALIPPA